MRSSFISAVFSATRGSPGPLGGAEGGGGGGLPAIALGDLQDPFQLALSEAIQGALATEESTVREEKEHPAQVIQPA
ncbi:MAG: hypothetical protein ACLQVX_09670 [Limisphaerales bacterium]